MTKRKVTDISKDDCPICQDSPIDRKKNSGEIKTEDEESDDDSEMSLSWIQCSLCFQWYHSLCAKLDESQIEELKSYHCQSCAPKHGPSIIRRKSARTRVSIDYVALNEGNKFAIDKSVHPHIQSFQSFQNELPAGQSPVTVLSNISKQYVLTNKLTKPVHIPSADLDLVGMQLPVDREKITVPYVSKHIGEDTPVEVMDVLTQQGVKPSWKLAQWRDYFSKEESNRDRIRNVISLEISHSEELGQKFHRPEVVRDMDIVDKIWPKGFNKDNQGEEESRPKVTKYCLMSVKGSFTDFHIDFGGTSVYYTVCSGSKEFLMFPPTDHNLKLYKNWCLEQDQNFMWLPDYNKESRSGPITGGLKVKLNVGDLFMIPSGWIHAVYTPEDSVVIGGNYLTLSDLKMELKINEIEKLTKVPARFRFPSFNKVWWLTSWYYYNNPEMLKLDLVPNVKEESNEKIEDSDVIPKDIITNLISHLVSHYDLSKTYRPAKGSIPYSLIGKSPSEYLEKLMKWRDAL
ncbi:jmjC domain-containing histone demethylation protein 1 [[Candida] railenensis]|uniref:JmjC domain-containing histone demethylation protein 1 n=1 Tax=[Candida] railenensis TaxID=45579 RepID=A0A9P0QNT6_9ASCO|nr:jmjC domain-containing histone demethylation protein 1 [[Candida] railenensis]